LVAEHQKLEDMRQNLFNLRSQQSQNDQMMTLNSPARISENDQRIRNLLNLLQAHRLSENDVDQAANQALRDQNSQAQADRDQIDVSIQTVTDQIHQIEEQFNYTQIQPPLNAEDQRTTLDNLANQRVALIDQLNSLRLQRAQISANSLNQTRAIQGAAQRDKTDLIANETAIEDEIGTLQDEIQEIQQAREQERMSSQSLSQQIRDAERAYNDQAVKIKNLEKSIQ
jgi:hypothetical protein